jgi:hypothetical protein
MKIMFCKLNGTAICLTPNKSDATKLTLADAAHKATKQYGNGIIEKVNSSLPDGVGANYIVSVINNQL